MRTKLLLVTGLALVLAACNGSENTGACSKDGDCGLNSRCDIYAKVCRCVNDNACNVAANEKCMPDGTCQVYTGCKSDPECGGCKKCDLPTGKCLCTDNCGCSNNEICNASGYCQPNTGCFDNQDCAPGQYCDVGTKACIENSTCTNKFQCSIGYICTNGSCVAGCEDYGDCPLLQSCVSGKCTAGVCEDDTFCAFMQSCTNGTCVNDYNQQNSPYCDACSGLNSCGASANSCLLYPYVGDDFDRAYKTKYPSEPSSQYCGVDCSGGQRCPVGFSCNSISIVKQTDDCTSSQKCPGSLPCIKDPESDKSYCPCNDATNRCPDNSTCFTTDYCLSHKCLASSISCNQTSDCNICLGDMKHCTSNADCKPITCELESGQQYGWCSVGKCCGLNEGYHCIPK